MNLSTAEEFHQEMARLALQCERLTVQNDILETRLEVAVQRGRLTDAERRAVEVAARIAGAVGESGVKAALRSLLERTK